MKAKFGKTLMLLIVVVAHSSLRSQPQFTVNNCFSVGDSTGIGSGASIVMISDMIAQTGSNYTWDFSNYNEGGPIYSWTSPIHPYVFQTGSSSSQLQFQSYPILENPGNAGLAFSRAFSYSDDLDTLYQRAWGNQSSNIYINTPPLPYLSFPMNYQEVGSAVFTNYYSVIPVSVIRREWKYDGFGNINMPYGQINGVYRFHTVQRDSSLFDGTVTTVNELIWFKQSTGIPVLRFTESYGGGFTAFYTSDIGGPSSIDGHDFNSIEVFPNPTDGLLQINFGNAFTPNAGKRILIENAYGQRITDQVINDAQLTLNIEQHLQGGLCFLHVLDDSGSKVFTKKVILK
jgi:hypothetical protein